MSQFLTAYQQLPPDLGRDSMKYNIKLVTKSEIDCKKTPLPGDYTGSCFRCTTRFNYKSTFFLYFCTASINMSSVRSSQSQICTSRISAPNRSSTFTKFFFAEV